jgi:U3 small nucleolar RNA-associated protein 25
VRFNFDIYFLLTWNRDLKSVEELVTDQDESVEDLQSEVISSDEDSKEASVVQPYAALLQSLAVDSRPPAKKRRLDTAQVADTGNRRNEEITLDCSNDADRVVEPEEGPELAVDGLLDEDESEAGDASDPFESHFTHINDDCLSKRLKAIQSSQWTTLKATLPKLGEVVFSIPEATEGTEINLPIVSGPEQLKLKQKLAVSISRQKPIFDFLEKSLAPCIFHYHDIFFCGRIPTNSESLRRLACLHAVNHVFK